MAFYCMYNVLPFCYIKGPLEDCEYGYYGTDCKQACGSCSGAAQCDRVTGECANGCMPGYYSVLCDIGKLPTYLLPIRVYIYRYEFIRIFYPVNSPRFLLST